MKERKMTKKGILLAAGILVLTTGAGAQMLTKEVNSDLQFIATLNNYYQSFQNVQNSLTMIQQNYERMQRAIQEAMTWDFSNIQWQRGTDPFSALTNANRAVSSLLENTQRAQNALNSETIMVNGNRYSLADLAGFGNAGKNLMAFGNDVADAANSLLQKTAAIWASDLSDVERKFIQSRYGLTAEAYKIVDDASQVVNDSLVRTVADVSSSIRYEAEREMNAGLAEVLQLLLSGGELTEKEIGQMQGALQGYTIQQLQTLTQSLQDYIGYAVLKDQQDRAVQQMKDEAAAKVSSESFRKGVNPNF